MAKVVDRFVADTGNGEVEFNLYSDNELLITVPSFASYTLSEDDVDRVRKMLGVKAVEKKAEVKKEKVAVACDRLLPKVRLDPNGWSAAVGYDAENPALEVRFVYSTREKARHCSHLHKVGENGRVK